MKKSQLRKIIRESIQTLMTEQNQPNYKFYIETCPCTSYDAATNSCSTATYKYNYILIAPGMNGNTSANYELNPQIGGTICNNDITMDNSMVPMVCDNPNGLRRIMQFQQGWSGALPNNGAIRKYSPNGCTTGGPSPSGCDTQAWSNYSSWLSNFTSLPNFSSSNPNQPCQFLCQKHTQWSNQIQNVGPVQANQLQCKIDEVQSLMQTHNCASSNAPAC